VWSRGRAARTTTTSSRDDERAPPRSHSPFRSEWQQRRPHARHGLPRRPRSAPARPARPVRPLLRRPPPHLARRRPRLGPPVHRPAPRSCSSRRRARPRIPTRARPQGRRRGSLGAPPPPPPPPPPSRSASADLDRRTRAQICAFAFALSSHRVSCSPKLSSTAFLKALFAPPASASAPAPDPLDVSPSRKDSLASRASLDAPQRRTPRRSLTGPLEVSVARANDDYTDPRRARSPSRVRRSLSLPSSTFPSRCIALTFPRQ